MAMEKIRITVARLIVDMVEDPASVHGNAYHVRSFMLACRYATDRLMRIGNMNWDNIEFRNEFAAGYFCWLQENHKKNSIESLQECYQQFRKEVARRFFERCKEEG